MAHRISYSGIQSFLGCRQRWDFSSRLRMGFRPETTPMNLAFGSAWAEAQQILYHPELWHAGDGNRAALAQSKFAEVIQWHLAQLEENEETTEEYQKASHLGQDMIDFYVNWAKTHDDFTPIGVEREFAVPILNPWDDAPMRCGPDWDARSNVWCKGHDDIQDVLYVIRVDGLVQDRDGAYWVKEDKTTARGGDTRYLDMDLQLTSYLWALKQAHPEIPFQGAVWTQASKIAPEPPKIIRDGTQVSLDKRQLTTPELYAQAVLDLHGINGADGGPKKNAATYLAKRAEYFDFIEYLMEPEYQEKFIRRRRIPVAPGLINGMGRRLYNITVDMLTGPSIYPHVTMMNCNNCPFFGPCLARQEGEDFGFMLETGYTTDKEKPTYEDIWVDRAPILTPATK